MVLSRYSKQGERAFTIYKECGKTFKTNQAASAQGIERAGPIMSSLRGAGIIVHTGEKTNGKKKCTIPQQRWGPNRITTWEFTDDVIRKFEWWIARERDEAIKGQREYEKVKA